MPINTPPVIAGELIEAAWGNTVRNDLLALDSGKVGTTGAWSMSGQLTVNATGGVQTTGQVQAGANPITTGSAGSVITSAGRIVTNITAENPPNVSCDRYGTSQISAGSRFQLFKRSGDEIGSITVASASSTGFNTTSDPRLKERTGDAADAADVVQALGAKVYRGRWIADEGEGAEWVFVNSTDVEPVAPYAVQGTAGAVATQADVEAGLAAEAGDIIAQQLDHSALVPLLTAALSQTLDRVDTLSARIEALEGAAT